MGHKKYKRKRRILISENVCPVCNKPLDKWQDMKLCSNCGYKSKEKQADKTLEYSERITLKGDK